MKGGQIASVREREGKIKKREKRIKRQSTRKRESKNN